MNKRFDVIVYGATGFTGSLVARYLISEPESAPHNPSALKWAMAARNTAKLMHLKEQLKEKLPEVGPNVIDAIPTIVADSHDEDSLTKMVQQTQVVVSLVGPYKLYGELLVKVCAENGVHYCDLTGEIVWIKEMITKYATVAASSGAILVNCCGFESIPSDLATFLVSDQIQQQYQSTTSQIDLYFTAFQGEASGGTLASIFAIFETSTTEELLSMCHPYFLTDETTMAEKQLANLVTPNGNKITLGYDKVIHSWHSLFIGSAVNQAIVHRSNALLQNKYGDKFVYHERMAIGGFLKQLLSTIGILVLSTLLYFSWSRALIKRVVRAPGQGPSEKVMQHGFFTAQVAGYADDGKLAVTAKILGDGDPGYRLTSRLIAECALSLAKHEMKTLPGGFYTPASAFGYKLIDRLQTKKLLTFEYTNTASK